MSWLIEHKGKNESYAEEVNFLFRKDPNIFIMDNHRLALWCWWQVLTPGTYNLLHIDAHYDNAGSSIEYIRRYGKAVHDLNLNEYIDLENTFSKYKVFRWDNYFPLFFEDNRFQIENFFSLDHKIGEKFIRYHQPTKPYTQFEELFPENIFRITDFLQDDSVKTIVNIDFDYFFSSNCSVKKILVYSEEYISKIFKEIRAIKSNLAVLTACLSPECCGGWQNAEKILKLFERQFSIKWNYRY